METGQLHKRQSGPGQRPAEYALTSYRPTDDILTDNRANYHIQSISDVFIENQGSWVVQVKNFTLLPGDILRIRINGLPYIEDRLNVRFLAAFSFSQPIASYPQLYNGKRLLITKVAKV